MWVMHRLRCIVVQFLYNIPIAGAAMEIQYDRRSRKNKFVLVVEQLGHLCLLLKVGPVLHYRLPNALHQLAALPARLLSETAIQGQT